MTGEKMTAEKQDNWFCYRKVTFDDGRREACEAMNHADRETCMRCGGERREIDVELDSPTGPSDETAGGTE